MILRLLQWINQGVISTMEKIAEMKNNWNDFASFHGTTAFLFCFVGIPLFAFLSISADYDVMYGMFYNTSHNEIKSMFKAGIFAFAIFFILTITSGNIAYILVKKLYKVECLDEKDNLVKNEKVNYHRKMMFSEIVLFIIALSGTGWLSLNTDQKVKAQSENVKSEIYLESHQRDTINLHRSQRRLLSLDRTFSSDTAILNQITRDRIVAESRGYYAKVKETEGNIAKWKKLSKVGSDRQRKEAPKSIAYLEGELAKYKAKVNRYSASALKDRSKELQKLQSKRSKAVSVVLSTVDKRDSLSISQYQNESKGLEENISIAANTTIGYNIGFNLVIVVITCLMVYFYIGVNFGKKPIEATNKAGKQRQTKSANTSKQKKKKNTAKSVTTRGSGSKKDLRLALRSARGSLSSYTSRINNGKNTQNNINKQKHWQTEVDRIEKLINE